MKNDKRIIILFLVITFGLMFGAHLVVALILNADLLLFNNPIVQALTILGGGAPAFAALFIVYKRYSNDEQKQYWKSVYQLKVPWYWWVFIGLAPVLLGFITNLIRYSNLSFFTWSNEYILRIPITFAIMIFAGGAEELGWRGILQRHLHGKIPLAVIGLIIGVIWGVWHLPLFFIDAFAHYDFVFITYLLTTVLFSLWMTGVVYKTNRIGLAVLMHAMLNTMGAFGLGIPMIINPYILVVLISLIVISLGWLMSLKPSVEETS